MYSEPVEVWILESRGPVIRKITEGKLILGDKGLPLLSLEAQDGGPTIYDPLTVPDAWTLLSPRGGERGLLLRYWEYIQATLAKLRERERVEGL
jgi:hypothetical protein